VRRLSALLCGLSVLLLTACGAHDVSTPASPPPSSAPTVLLPDGSHLVVRIADRPADQMRGLMFVANLPDDEGMLFLFQEEAPRSFWMKNCLMPIDMVWLDRSFRIVDITHSAPPCQADPCPEFAPRVPAQNVLEVRGGLAREKGLKEGDTLVVVGIAAPGDGVARGG